MCWLKMTMSFMCFTGRVQKLNFTMASAGSGRRLVAAILAVPGTLIFYLILVIASLISKLLWHFPENALFKRSMFFKEARLFNLSHKTLPTCFVLWYTHILCVLKVGSTAPNINLLALDGTRKKILDFQRAGRPLVVNFGSCS